MTVIALCQPLLLDCPLQQRLAGLHLLFILERRVFVLWRGSLLGCTFISAFYRTERQHVIYMWGGREHGPQAAAPQKRAHSSGTVP